MAPMLRGLYLLSGIAALLYQVVWTRQLALHFGVSAHATATTVSAFMLGLALGSTVLGRVADRVRRPLLGYAALELGVAVTALASLAALAAVESALSAAWVPELSPAAFGAVRTGVTFVVLLVPTALMGGTLPMLVRAQRSAGAGRAAGSLYGANALGGALGSVLAGFVTLSALGLRGSLLVGAGLNGLAAAGAAALARRTPAADPRATAAPAPAAPARPRGAVAGMRAAFFLAGLAGLAVEVVWTRLLLMNLASTAQSFAAMLAVCLVGLAGGSLATARVADRGDPARRYGACLLLAAVAIVLCASLWATTPTPAAARWLVDRLPAGLRGNASYRTALALAQSALLLLVPSLLFGAAFPFAARFFAEAPADRGRRLGGAVALNTLGCVVGPLLAGFGWLPAHGTQGTLLLCAGAAAAAGGAALATVAGRTRWVALPAALVGATLTLVSLPAEGLLAHTEQRRTGRVLHAEEDATGSVAVLEVDVGYERFRQLAVGTTSMITDGFACRRYTRLLGHLPMLLHEAPRDALVVCLGSGMTLSAVAAHPDVEAIDCVELSPAVVRAARTWFSHANGGVLDDPRVRVVVDDGRTHLLRTERRYDVIALEPPPPYNDGVASLYSRELYALCRARLRPGGVVSQWIPYHGATLAHLRSMLATLRAEFPAVTLWELFDGREYCAVGHLDDAPVPLERLAARLGRPAVAAHLEAGGVRHLEDVLACFVMGTRGLDAFVAGARQVTDDRPGLGYDLAADGVVAPSGRRFQGVIQASSLATEAFEEDPARYLRVPDPDALRDRLAPVKRAWRMHALAHRLLTLRPADHPEVFASPFVSPLQLDPGNRYYDFSARRGVYDGARARQQRVRSGADD